MSHCCSTVPSWLSSAASPRCVAASTADVVCTAVVEAHCGTRHGTSGAVAVVAAAASRRARSSCNLDRETSPSSALRDCTRTKTRCRSIVLQLLLHFLLPSGTAPAVAAAAAARHTCMRFCGSGKYVPLRGFLPSANSTTAKIEGGLLPICGCLQVQQQPEVSSVI